MRYEDLKKILVEDTGKLTGKELRRLAVFLGLFMVGCSLLVGMLVLYVLRTSFALVAVALGVVGYMWFMDACAEEDAMLKRARLMSRLWFLPYLALIAEILVLTLYGFR